MSTTIITKLQKLAKETLPNNIRYKLNSLIYGIQGMDYIKSILNNYNFDIGPKLSKNKYALIYKEDTLKNVYLKGDYSGMEIVTGDVSIPKVKPKFDPESYSSFSAIYERFEE